VAAANLRAGQEVHRALIQNQNADAELFPSYRVPLAIAHRWWKKGRIDEAANLVRRFIADNTPPPHPALSPDAGGEGRVRGPQQFGHAVPLLAEHALLLAEQGDHARAQRILRPLQEGCRLFGDFETLGRIGRAYKESGDDKWEKNPVPFAELQQKPPWQMYRHALAIYTEAFDLSGAYYPGINAATLALLCGDVQQARALARKVLEQCAKEDVDGERAVWVFASEGEACLLVGREDAAGYYAAALDELDPSQPRLAQSMYNQLCRLWQALGSDALEPVLQTFAQRPAFWSQLTPGPVGDCGGRKKPASS
jgi:tetratricopeptide (TPR) repeat protein